ncbi:hypothetical protein IAI10_02620 [Clostridium sp. 19966]|nr:hypothetical protein [Clostridium sp. 19966]MDT8715553.1 hypothetical protein [Clostridium sp. 19966]
MSDNLAATIKRIGDKYKEAPRHIKITVGYILAGKNKLIVLKGEKINE